MQVPQAVEVKVIRNGKRVGIFPELFTRCNKMKRLFSKAS
jgi:hypothetical protein